MKAVDYQIKIRAQNRLRALQRRIIMLLVSLLLSSMALVVHVYLIPAHYPELILPLGVFTFLFSIYICILVVRDDEFRLNGVFDFIFGSKSAKYDIAGDKLDISFMLSSRVFTMVAALKYLIGTTYNVKIVPDMWTDRDIQVADIVDGTVRNSVHPCTGNITIFIRVDDGKVVKFMDMGPTMFLNEMEHLFDNRTLDLIDGILYSEENRADLEQYMDKLIMEEYMGGVVNV